MALCHVSTKLLVQFKLPVADLTFHRGYLGIAAWLTTVCNREFLLKSLALGSLGSLRTLKLKRGKSCTEEDWWKSTHLSILLNFFLAKTRIFLNHGNHRAVRIEALSDCVADADYRALCLERLRVLFIHVKNIWLKRAGFRVILFLKPIVYSPQIFYKIGSISRDLACADLRGRVQIATHSLGAQILALCLF